MMNEVILILSLPATQDNLLAVKSSHNAVQETDRVRVKKGIVSLKHDLHFTAMSDINNTSVYKNLNEYYL